MKLLTTPQALKREFLRLLDRYEEYHFATAWAGVGKEPYEKLEKHRARIQRLVVGIHFYQTHPDFIEELYQHKGVRFMEQPNGIFHPKLYLFQNSPEDWALLVGSANFTEAAFSKNTEATMLVSSADGGCEGMRADALNLIKVAWNEALVYDQKKLTDYRAAWARMQPKQRSLGNQYSKGTAGPPIHLVPVCTMDWSTYMARLRARQGGNIPMRLQLMQQAQELFRDHDSFADMDLDDRKRIAGTYTRGAQVLDWKLFGSMTGAGRFKWELDHRKKFMSDALEEIPFAGQVTESHYRRYLKAFMAGTAMKHPLATATRLLAMKRPDVFVCVASKNKQAMAQAIEAPASRITLDSYWNEIIERIQDSEWWKNPAPSNAQEQQIESARAAFLDVLYYRP